MGEDKPWATAADKKEDSDEKNDKKEDDDDDADLFPLPFLLVIIGYTLILALDKVVFGDGKHHEEHISQESHDENQILE